MYVKKIITLGGYMTHYNVGEVIANSIDPFAADFCCGSVKQVINGDYQIHFYGGLSFIICYEEAVLLRDVLNQNISNELIIADKSFIEQDEGHRIFVGGRITSGQYGTSEKFCIKSPRDGKNVCVLSENCMPAVEALQLIEPCPRSLY